MTSMQSEPISGIFHIFNVLSCPTEAKNSRRFGAKMTPEIFSVCPLNTAMHVSLR